MANKIHGHLDLLILSVLNSSPNHGYGIISELLERSDGMFDMPEGTVYPALHRLEARHFVESSWAEGATRRRRIYRLTDDGRAALARERQEWSEMSTGIRSVLGWSLCHSLT